MNKAATFLATALGIVGSIPTIRLAESVKPIPPRRGDADAICAAEAKRARKRAKRIKAREFVYPF